MDERLETYLQTMENELGGLEAEQRDNELREMRQHIEAIVARLVEGGLSESEAIEAAVAQFGNAPMNGRALRKVHRKRDAREKIAKAVGGALLCFFAPILLVWPLENWVPHQSHAAILGLSVIGALAAGVVAATVAPHSGKRALLWLFGLFFAIEPMSQLVNIIPFWIEGTGPSLQSLLFKDWRNDLVTLALFFLIWLGASIKERHPQSRDLTRA